MKGTQNCQKKRGQNVPTGTKKMAKTAKLIQESTKWLKIAKNCPKWSKMDQNLPKWTKMA